MRIEVESLTGAGRAFAFTYEEEQLSLDDDDARLKGRAEVRGTASRKDDEVRLRGEIRADVEVGCDRCLSRFSSPLTVEFDATFVSQAEVVRRPDNFELLPKDLALASYDGEAIDIDEFVREQILLALPSRTLCRDDCKGLCPHCGADLNAERCSCEKGEIDPRWGALAEWKKKKE